mgnify:CR=1 FL=1
MIEETADERKERLMNQEYVTEVLEQVSPEQREIVQGYIDRVKNNLVRAAITQVMARNNSHGYGTYVIYRSKK